MGAKNSKTDIERANADIDTHQTLMISLTTDESMLHPNIQSLTELKSLKSVGSNVSSTSTKSQKKKKEKRRRSKELRKIRDKPDRMCRKASMAPDQAFIVEEALLEDLCEIAGEEAYDGGNIILSHEKEELLRRLSVNSATANIFNNTTNFRKFSTNSMRGLSVAGSEPSGRVSPISQERSPHRQPRGSINSIRRGSILSNLTVNLNPEGVEDPVRLRRQSIKNVQTTSPNGAHDLMTQANYRSEIQALKMAQKRETCSFCRNCFAICNIYI